MEKDSEVAGFGYVVTVFTIILNLGNAFSSGWLLKSFPISKYTCKLAYGPKSLRGGQLITNSSTRSFSRVSSLRSDRRLRKCNQINGTKNLPQPSPKLRLTCLVDNKLHHPDPFTWTQC